MLEPDQMYEAHVNLIHHGRKVCHAQRPGPRRLPAPAALPLRRPEGALTAPAQPIATPYTRAMLSGPSAGATAMRRHGSCSSTTTATCSSRWPTSSATTASTSTTARDGEEALRRLDTSWPDLLIIDMMMPRMDGLTLAREVKARADLPIIVLSAIDAGDNKADLLDEFAEDYVTKPYHYPELRARIQRVLRRVGDRVPRKGLDLGPDLTLELHRRQAVVARRDRRS